ncbi:MAG TPA: hypothetical protein VHY20_11555, partial [Pirellulales bacterium]|nr:hypothetical protein [Pirellulales bacterium]
MCAYQREISRDHKACVLFLLDHSESMAQRLGGSTRRKCDELASAVNNWLHNMAIRASSDDGIRDWLDIGVIGYSTTKELTPVIAPALEGPLAGRPLVSITEIGNHPARIETSMQQFRDEASGEVLEMASDTPLWVDPEAAGSTPMCHVLKYARQVLSGWIAAHANSFP